MKIILFEPQIPQNTGNVVRSCSVTGSELMLVGPCGFSFQDRHLKRAGLDYWEGVRFEFLENEEAFISYLSQTSFPFVFFSSHATMPYTQISYKQDHQLIFGSETSGLSQRLLALFPDRSVTIPMKSGARCLNLATSVGIGLFEAWRQCDFTFA